MSNLIAGIDVGTTKVCVLIGELTSDDAIHIVAVGQAPSRGLRRGVVVNISAVSYTHLRAHETVLDIVCRLLLEKKKPKSHTESQLTMESESKAIKTNQCIQYTWRTT